MHTHNINKNSGKNQWEHIDGKCLVFTSLKCLKAQNTVKSKPREKQN